MCRVLTEVIFCFKQKTAYEMRISDWSSDVCSSDIYQQILCDAKNIDIGLIRRSFPDQQSGEHLLCQILRLGIALDAAQEKGHQSRAPALIQLIAGLSLVGRQILVPSLC